MNLPLFRVQDDPGPDFNRLLATSGIAPTPIDGALDPLDYRHGTTCVAIRFEHGVLLAGDRRATSGNLISHRTLEKVFPSEVFWVSHCGRSSKMTSSTRSSP